MTSIRAICLLALTGAFLATTVIAQPPTAKGSPEHDVLKKMVGTWDTTMKMGGNEEKGTATYKMDLGGLWLSSTFESTMMGQKFSGRGMDSYDPNKKKYVGVWFDSMSSTPMVMEGTYDKSTKTMTMFGDAPGMDGKMAKHRIVTQLTDENTMNFAMYLGDDKEPGFTILYKRKK